MDKCQLYVNFVPEMENGEPVYERIDKIPDDYKYDSRMNIAVRFDGVDSKSSIGNYYSLMNYRIAELLRDGFNTSSMLRNEFKAYLEAGYIPIIAPPTFFDPREYKRSEMIEFLRKVGAEYIEVRPMDLNGKFISAKGAHDIWLSKLWAAERLGCNPRKVSILKALQSIGRSA